MTRHRCQLMAAATAAAAVLAGCGGASSPSSATSSGADGHAPSAQLLHGLLRFTICVRSHGAPDVPDPGTRAWKEALGSPAPAVQGAERTCQRLVPGVMPSGQTQGPSQSQTPAHIAAMVAFAGCLRDHGFPRFPDPTSTGQLTHAMVANAGINVHQPAVLRAGNACTRVTHGAITQAMVARFVAEQ